MYWLMCLMALVFGSMTIVVSFNVPDGKWVILGLGVLFVLCGLCMFIRPVTVVDSSAGVLSRQSRLFGNYLVWNRQFYFSEFSAVVVRRVRRSNSGRDPDQFFVSLRRQSGRQLLISYFEGDIAKKSRPADELASRLSTDLKIKVDEYK
jgi:hypothetical protein